MAIVGAFVFHKHMHKFFFYPLGCLAWHRDFFADHVDQDQTPQNMQSDLESTLSDKYIYVPIKQQYLRFSQQNRKCRF